MNPNAAKQLFRDVVAQVWHRGNLAFIREAYRPEYVATVSRQGFQDLGQFRRYVAETRSAFPDLRLSIEQQVAEGDLLAARYRVTGTQTGEFMGLPPSRRSVDVAGMTMERIAGGRFAESWTCWDVIGLLHQIGIVPELADLTAHR